MAYQCTDEHWKLLEEQMNRDIMDHHSIKYNLIYTARDALMSGKKLRWFDGNYLTAIPSLADYNRHHGGVQTFEIEGDVTHKKMSKAYKITITRTVNQAIHKFIEILPGALENLPVEAETQGNRKFDREDKSNVIPYIIQEVKAVEGGTQMNAVQAISNRYA